MTEDSPTPIQPSASAGAMLRQYREAQGMKLGVLAYALRVPPAKLQSLEDDRLDDLPDVVFARVLALAVCRQLKVDAAPVLALLPSQDASRLAVKDERGLDFPLHRPSLLPESGRSLLANLLTPRYLAVWAVLLIAGVVSGWPDLQSWQVFKTLITSETEAVRETVQAEPLRLDTPQVIENSSGRVVVTPVYSALVAAQAAQAAQAAHAASASVSGVPSAK